MDKLLGHLLLEVELRVELADGDDLLFEFGLDLAAGAQFRILEFRVQLADLRVEGDHFLRVACQRFHVALAVFDLLVNHDAVEAFFAVEEFLRKAQIATGDEAKAVQVAQDIVFCGLDALGDLDLFLAGQQRGQPHLLEIHAHGVVEDVEFGVRLLRHRLRILVADFLDAIDLGGVDDIELHAVEAREDFLHDFGLDHVAWQCLVDVVEGEVALLLGEFDEVAELLLDQRAIDFRPHVGSVWLARARRVWKRLGRILAGSAARAADSGVAGDTDIG